MSGRFAQDYTWKEIQTLYGPGTQPAETEIAVCYNSSGNGPIDTVRLEHGRRIMEPMRWGLIPGWWRLAIEPTNPAAFNAHIDIVGSAPLFQSSFGRQHCLIPASGFYEFNRNNKPYFFSHRDGLLMTIAGLWDEWRNPDTREVVRSCSAVIGASNKSIAELSGSMPVVLEPEHFELWLAGEAGIKLIKSFGQIEPSRHLTWRMVERP